jgi:hypothetical protein
MNLCLDRYFAKSDYDSPKEYSVIDTDKKGNGPSAYLTLNYYIIWAANHVYRAICIQIIDDSATVHEP